jgi:hypothetical protein
VRVAPKPTAKIALKVTLSAALRGMVQSFGLRGLRR